MQPDEGGGTILSEMISREEMYKYDCCCGGGGGGGELKVKRMAECARV